jgi:hypothetical protein
MDESDGDNLHWMVWHLADDPATYGDNAGKPIITTTDGEDEICSVLAEQLATQIVEAHNKTLDLLRINDAATVLLLEAAKRVVTTWEHGDLAGAVRSLDALIPLPPKPKPQP